MFDRIRSLLPTLVVLAAVAALLSESLFGGRVLAPYDALAPFEPWRSETTLAPTNELLLDQPLVTLPWKAFFAERLAAGEVPLWNPYDYLGQPVHAAVTGGLLWPLDWPLLATGNWSLLAWIAAAKLVLAGVLCGAFLRRIGLGRAAATLGSVAYALCGFQVVWLGHPHTNVALLLPLALWSVERVASRPDARGTAVVALWVAAAGVGGHVQTALHVGVAVAAYVAARATVVGAPRVGASALARLAVGAAIGAALAAPQVLPFVEYLGLSRASSLFADVDVTSSLEPWRAAVLLLDPWFHGSPLDGSYTGPNGSHLNFNEVVGGHVGLVALGLALVGAAVAIRRRSRGWTLALLGTALAACLAWQVPPIYDLARATPVLASTKVMRFALLLAFGLACLAAYGLDAVLARLPRGGRPAAAAVAVAVAAIELVAFGRGINPTCARDDVFAPTPTLSFLGGVEGRAIGTDAMTLAPNANLPFHVSVPHGYDSIELDRVTELVGLLTTDPARRTFLKYVAYFDRSIPLANALALRWVVTSSAMPPPFALAFEGPGGLRVYENPGALDRAYLARGHRVVSDAEQRLALLGAEDFDPLVAIVEAPPPFEVAAHDAPPGRAELVVDEPRRLAIDVRADAPALLVVADANYPGWIAEVDGEESEIVAVDHALRGVWLTSGDHRVEMRYEPASFRTGLLLAGLGAVALAFLLLPRRRRADAPPG
ncbi:MAG: YfhO family protein [Planctomycetota bacterium]